MSDYIKREDVLNTIAIEEEFDTPDLVRLASAIENLPSADVVEVVRCNDCNAYNTSGYAEGGGWCYYHHSVMETDGYCSCGKERQ